MPTARAAPHGVVADRAGNIWFTANSKGYIGELDPKTGRVREHPVEHAGGADPHTAVFDKWGLLWFTAQRSNLIREAQPANGARRGARRSDTARDALRIMAGSFRVTVARRMPEVHRRGQTPDRRKQRRWSSGIRVGETSEYWTR